eukprot:gene10590-450_t
MADPLTKFPPPVIRTPTKIVHVPSPKGRELWKKFEIPQEKWRKSMIIIDLGIPQTPGVSTICVLRKPGRQRPRTRTSGKNKNKNQKQELVLPKPVFRNSASRLPKASFAGAKKAARNNQD